MTSRRNIRSLPRCWCRIDKKWWLQCYFLFSLAMLMHASYCSLSGHCNYLQEIYAALNSQSTVKFAKPLRRLFLLMACFHWRWQCIWFISKVLGGIIMGVFRYPLYLKIMEQPWLFPSILKGFVGVSFLFYIIYHQLHCCRIIVHAPFSFLDVAACTCVLGYIK